MEILIDFESESGKRNVDRQTDGITPILKGN